MSQRSSRTDPKAAILRIMDENRLMTVATLRPDGWPHATIVGYVHDDLTLYFAVARSSQKVVNIERDPRVSIALGQEHPDRLRGLSMGAHAMVVNEIPDIERLNALLTERYPEQARFAPRAASAALIRAIPFVVSLIDVTSGRREVGHRSSGVWKRALEGGLTEGASPSAQAASGRALSSCSLNTGPPN